ncbi:radical SAM protein, partial [bacterium]
CHMPLQSGADSMLRRMKRLYTRESFGEIVASLRRAVPGIGLTTDLIVGFPGETEEEYEATLDAVREYRFDGAFCFAYSPRPGTPAAVYEEQLDPGLKNERLRRLIALQESITGEINEALVGAIFEVLIEGPSSKNPERMQGFTREGRMMHFAASPDRVGRLARVRAVGAHRWGLSGELHG